MTRLISCRHARKGKRATLPKPLLERFDVHYQWLVRSWYAAHTCSGGCDVSGFFSEQTGSLPISLERDGLMEQTAKNGTHGFAPPMFHCTSHYAIFKPSFRKLQSRTGRGAKHECQKNDPLDGKTQTCLTLRPLDIIV